MKAQSLRVFERMYAAAKTSEDLPWHNPEPPPMLAKAMDQRTAPGTALDIGCGGGTYSVFMARRGYAVTALDFMPQAVAMVNELAAGEDLSIEAVQADIGEWTSAEAFDVVLDVGCMHTPGSIEHAHYKKQLLNWLAPGGDFILLHFGRRAWWDRWPIGPSRTYKDDLIALFEPEFTLIEYVPRYLSGMRLLLGRSALVGQYWFKRNV